MADAGVIRLRHIKKAKRSRLAHPGKVEKVMREYKMGELRSGSKHGPMVTSKKQAIAIALSEARKGRKA